MAQLPTAEALGERPIPRPTPAVAVAEPNHEARALEALGRAAAEMGVKMADARRSAEFADAMGRATEELEAKAVEFARDQDFKTSPERFKQTAKAIGENYAKTIDDSMTRDMFTRGYEKKAHEKHLTVFQQAAKQEQDYHVASLDEREAGYVRQAVEAPEGVAREAVLFAAQGDLSLMRAGGWISDVDAGKRERALRGKIDQAVVTRDLAADPVATAGRLSNDAAYASNMDPLTRERMVDQAFRRSESERAMLERQAEKARRDRGDAALKEAFALDSKGALTRGYVEKIRDDVTPAEYHSLLKALDGGERKDDPAAFAELQSLAYDNPKEAERRAFLLHKAGRIKNDTLASVLNRARGVDRQEGPRSPYERERAYITQVLKPSDFAPDPAASARFAQAVREYDDFADGGKRTDAELRTSADSIVRRLSMTNMAELAKRTSAEVRDDPKNQLDSLQKQTTRLQADFDAKRITQQKFNQEMAKVNQARKAAEAAQAAQGGRR